MIRVSSCYYCPEEHITTNSKQCDCGNRNLVPLQLLLDRKVATIRIKEDIRSLLSELPTLSKLRLNKISKFRLNKI